MLTIHWVGKPSNYDTRSVTMVWFPTPTKMHYVINRSSHVFVAKTKDVERIIADEIVNEFVGRT